MRIGGGTRGRLAIAIAGTLLLAGCGKSAPAVNGTVTWDGAPVEEGTISFAPSDGKGASSGAAISAGKYRVAGQAGLTPGKKTVSIQAVRKTGKKIPAGPPAPAGTTVDETVRLAGTDSCEIVPGDNQRDFQLKSKKR